MGATGGYSGYYQDQAAAFSTAMPQNTMPYQSEYGQDTRQTTQNFGAYNTPMMYNVPQAGAQSAVYDTSQQFPSRQPAAMQIMPTDVAAPYFPGEPTNSAAASGLQGQGTSSGTSAVYQQSPADQRAMLQNYPSGMASMSGMSQASSAPPEQPVQQEEEDYGHMGQAYNDYQAALKEIFTNIRNGVLMTASESLLNVSDWLLSKANELGLVVDNPELHHDRIKLWNDFNHAWLGLLQKQKDMVESGIAPQRGQALITEQQLTKMGKELVRMCDGIERHGLVDYEYGVWEEKIMDILTECLDLYDNNEEADTSTNAAGPSHSASR
ncbi:hypothetical protein E8E14_010490 [Neopestalotiopsis sp. 37M]|nr:hypothetical protein E8E14_010490 [Neopestalotiopsis sp. 37M]